MKHTRTLLTALVITSFTAVHSGPLLTCERLVRTADERRRLATESGAVACDLESHPQFREIRRVPLTVSATSAKHLSLRIISDGIQDELAPENRRPRPPGKLGRPLWGRCRGTVPPPGDLLKFQNESLKPADRLAKFLEEVVPQFV